MSQGSILVTGAAGFIGFHLSKKLSDQGYQVTGIDNVNDYYDPGLKESRLEILAGCDGFSFQKMDLRDKPSLDELFQKNSFDYVVNLAAQAGVGHSISHPYTYLESNLHGFLNVLEACRMFPPSHLLYASSSSVYGGNTSLPFSVHDNADHPMALYAASKKANELMAHAYSHLYQLPTTGLRFFSVYGTYGRPDMALFIFTRAILADKPINVYNFGKMMRDFTYIDDIVTAVINLVPRIPQPNPEWDSKHPDPATSFAPYRLYNIGNNKPIELMKFIDILEEKLKKKAIKNFLPMQEGDVTDACADISALEKEIGFRPSTPIEYGIGKFVDWYKDYYQVS
jgi:UDP-glucuronate 4-epimerase